MRLNPVRIAFVVSRQKRGLLLGTALALTLVIVASGLFDGRTAVADSTTINFDAYSIGTIHGQDGWSSSGAAGSGCATYDHAVAPNGGGYALRVSNAVTSGCFGDHTFSKSLVDEAGEASAVSDGMSGGTRQSRFESEFTLSSAVPGAQQPGLFMSVSPDRGDGARMSYLGFEDQADGIHVLFYDYQDKAPFGTSVGDANGCGAEDDFILTDIATLDRSVAHTVTFDVSFADGSRNDVVRIYLDGTHEITGTSWEDYFRYCEGNPTRPVDSLLFRTGGAAAPATAGFGYFIDDLTQTSSTAPTTTTTVTSSTMAGTGWLFYNDENDTVDPSLGSFVTGPGTPPLGAGSAQISVTGSQRRNLASYQFAGTELADITTLRFRTYNPSAGNGGSPNRSAYLNINVDFDGSDTWQRRLISLPSDNGTVIQNTWQEWDVIGGGAALLRYSGLTWPVTGGSGSTPKTWAQILADYPGVRIRVTDAHVGMRVGEPYANGYTENIDSFTFGTAAGTTIFDFDDDPCTTDCYVNAVTGNDANDGSTPTSAKKTIQAGVDAVSVGGTVHVATGTYPEHVIINKSITVTNASLPIIDGGGSGDVVTITADDVTLDGFEIRNGTNGVVLATGADNATVQNNEIHTFTSAGLRGNGGTGADINHNIVTGPHTASCIGGFWGILVNNTSGSIAFNTASGIGNGLTTGCQEGRAIEAQGAGTLGISDNTVSQYQKSGIIVRGTVNSTISANTTTGEGATSAIAMNGITVVSTGTTSITGNHTSGHHHTPEPTFSCGILYVPFGAATGAVIDGNDSTNDEVGICLSDAFGGPVSDVDVTNNTVDAHRQRGIDVDGMTNVLVDDNDIDGNGQGTTANGGSTPDDDTRYYGIFAVDSTGTISNNDITGITHGPANGTQSGVGIRATARSGGSTDVDIATNIISDIQKNAMVITNVYGGTVNADVTGNTATGNGPVSYIAQNGIQLSSGATGTIANNIVSDYDYTPATVSAVGILVIDAGTTSISGNAVSSAMVGIYVQQSDVPTISGNTVTGSSDTAIYTFGQSGGTYSANTTSSSEYGLYVADGTNITLDANIVTLNGYGIVVDGASQNVVATNNRIRFNGVGVSVLPFLPDIPTGTLVNNNCIADNTTYGMQVDPAVSQVNAENNWWGRNTGPNPPGTGDAIDSPATIDANPFLTAPTAGCPTPADGDGDGINDPADNCPGVVNPGQENTNGEPMPLPKPSPVFDDATNPAGDNEGDACDPDIDGDGVLNGTETSMGLSPYVWDTDGDRTNDGTEIQCGSNPLTAVSNLTGPDPDNDRLPTSCESMYGTNPAIADTDGDKVSDGVEVRYWMSNPTAVNGDGDNCTDDREIASVNVDRVVNSIDLGAVAARFGQLSPDFRPMDSNGDGFINSIDLGFMASRYGACTPT